MRIDITPEPTPQERAAIEQALSDAELARPPARGEWWRQGLLDAIDDEQER